MAKKVRTNQRNLIDDIHLQISPTDGWPPNRPPNPPWTGWQEKWATPKEYVNPDSDGVPHFPGLSATAAEFLVAHRLAAGVAIDTLSVDPGESKTFPAHLAILERQAFNVENIANLDKIPPRGYTVCVLPLPITGGTGSPARIIAFPTPK